MATVSGYDALPSALTRFTEFLSWMAPDAREQGSGCQGSTDQGDLGIEHAHHGRHHLADIARVGRGNDRRGDADKPS